MVQEALAGCLPWSSEDAHNAKFEWSPSAPRAPTPRVHLPGTEGGSVRLLLCTAPLLSSRWLGIKPRGPEQRDLSAAPAPRGLLGPVFFSSRAAGDSMGRNSAPCPTVATQTSILCRGSRDVPPRRRGGKRGDKEPIVSWGPGSEQGGPGQSQAGAKLSHAGQRRGEGQGGPGACGRGVSPGLGTPSHSLPGRGVFWMKLGCSPTPWVRNAMREGRGPCSSPGGGGQPAPAHL